MPNFLRRLLRTTSFFIGSKTLVKKFFTIEKILVSGGSCRIPGFQKYLQLETDIPVEELNPFSNLVIDEKNFDPKYLKYMAPQASVAVGLALRSIGDK